MSLSQVPSPTSTTPRKSFAHSFPHPPLTPTHTHKLLFPSFFTTSHLAACNNAVEAIKLLLASKPGALDLRNAQGQTPLVTACAHGSEEAALLLLEKGADKEARDCYEYDAEGYAAQHGLKKALEALRK